MAKGIWGFDPGSLVTGEAGANVPSGKNELPALPGAIVDVGEGKTSPRRDDASLRSEFHIPPPQENPDAPAPRPIIDGAGCELQGPALTSADGVLGCEVVGDMEPLAKEPLRGRGIDCDMSFNHEDRRTGLCGRAVECCAGSWRWSPSSSELAKASESGVDVRALTFSRRIF